MKKLLLPISIMICLFSFLENAYAQKKIRYKQYGGFRYREQRKGFWVIDTCNGNGKGRKFRVLEDSTLSPNTNPKQRYVRYPNGLWHPSGAWSN